jgi:small neutral amino acid transporter SnatA (MarC family)
MTGKFLLKLMKNNSEEEDMKEYSLQLTIIKLNIINPFLNFQDTIIKFFGIVLEAKRISLIK